MNTKEIIELLRSLENPENKAGMARFGINAENAFGISMKTLEPIARKIKKNHELALELWETGFHEARILSILIADPKKITSELMDK
jgi:3-methyladenine DNA glycosylase AlkD